MAPPKKSPASPDQKLPSPEQILEALSSNPHLRSKRDLSRHFSIAGDLRAPFKTLIRELEDKGLIARQKRTLRRASELPAVGVLKILADADPDVLIAQPVSWNEEHGEAPEIHIQTSRHDRAIPAPGDRILARIHQNPDQSWSAKTMKVLPAPRKARIGIVRMDEDGARLMPIDRKQKEMRIRSGDLGGAQDGDLVEVEVRATGRLMIDQARVSAIVGNPMSEGAVSLIALHNLDIPYRFSAKVLDEAKAARPLSLEGREDWRHIAFVTIDPADAKDHDDAVFAQPDTDPKNPGGHLVYVAIADVAAYVHPGTALDEEALLRGNSVYFPDRVVPMLPENISNDLCSLRQGEDRPALAVRMVFDEQGQKRGHSFHLVMIKVGQKLSYTQAQKAFDGFSGGKTKNGAPMLADLWGAYQAMARARDKRGPLDLDLPERRILLNEQGHVERIVVPERLEAHRLIEEMMIAANVCAAETLEEAHTGFIYRVHDQPGLEKIDALRQFLKSLDLGFTKDRSVRPLHFNQVLGAARKSGQILQVSEMILRSQARAEYNPENFGHFGLNLTRYTHFTSPIRRYADLMVHRAIMSSLKLTRNARAETDRQKLAEIAQEISATERRAMAAERETQDRLIAHYLSSRIGARFRGKISGVTRAGLFVRLDETGADGFVPAATLGRDYFRYLQDQQAMVGERTGERFRLGDIVEVKLREAEPLAGALRFELLSEGEMVSPPRSQGTKSKKNRTRSRPRSISNPRKRR